MFASRKLLILLAFFTPMIANADGQMTAVFKPTGLYISHEGNYHLRVQGVPAGCQAGWAYINQADSGSKTYIASLMLAFAAGKQVQLFVEPDGNGYCHIIEALIVA